MWPASLGGQSTQWDPAASAYILSEATHRYSALIGSPHVISHDEVLNSAQPGTPGKRLAFAVRAGGDSNHSVTVVVARNDEGSSSAPARMRNLLGSQAKFETEARSHYAELLESTLRIETPDDARQSATRMGTDRARSGLGMQSRIRLRLGCRLRPFARCPPAAVRMVFRRRCPDCHRGACSYG